MLKEFDEIRDSIQPIMFSCMRPLIVRVEEAIKPGLTLISWSSLNFDKYMDDVDKALQFLKNFSKKVCKIINEIN